MTHRLLVAQMHVRAMIIWPRNFPQGRALPGTITKIPNSGDACLEFTGRSNSRRSPEEGRKLNEAEELSIEAVEGLERILGESHPDTLERPTRWQNSNFQGRIQG